MDKIKINNQIVLMRKYVKQAKVHIINKLTKQTKLLQNRKGNEKQVEKAKRKADRFFQQINLIKKMKPDYVSKLALAKKQDWKEILEKKNSSLEDRCLAMLASYEPVQKEVLTFYNSNPSLSLKIPQLIKQWEEKNKPSKKFSKNSILKTTKFPQNEKILSKENDININQGINEITFKENPPVISEDTSTLKDTCTKEFENTRPEQFKEKVKISQKKDKTNFDLDEIENSFDSEFKKSFTNTEDITHNTENEHAESSSAEENSNNYKNCNDICDFEGEIQNKKSKRKENTASEINEMNRSVLNCTVELKENDQKSKNDLNKNLFNTKNPESLHAILPKQNNFKTITMLNLDELEGLEEIPVNQSSDSEVSEEEEENVSLHEGENDPFFLRKDDELNYQKHKPDISKTHPDNLPFISIDGKSHNTNFKNSFNQKAYFKNQFDKPSKSTFVKLKNNKNFKDTSYKYKDKYYLEGKQFKKEKFHLKNSKDTFKGKEKKDFDSYKKNFDEKIINKPKHEKRTQFFESKAIKEKETMNNTPLHPSWEAKKKQKELSKTPFMGKRTVFTD